MRKRLTALSLAIIIFFCSAAGVFAAGDASGSDVSGSDASASDVSASNAPAWKETETEKKRYTESQPMRDITANQLVKEINLGWNLGESLDCWSSDAGYDDYYNCNAYQMILRYDDAEGTRSTSIANVFNSSNTASFTWQTGLIDSDPQVGLGKIGFEIWNLTLDHEITVKVKCTEALLTRRNKRTLSFEELLGEHEVTISKYGTGALLTDKFSDDLSRTYGIIDGTFKVTMELVDFPQVNYGKPEYFETLWNNPLTTREMITEVKKAGFNAVRVPVTYFNHTVVSDSSIDAGWLNRIATIVDYCVDQDMYCIIDMHNDGSSTGWLRVNTSSSDAVVTKYETLWRQIAEHFKYYDEHLLFQGFNEITNKDTCWSYPGDADAEWVNSLNQKFVDTVRSTGENNAMRCLVISPYAGSYDSNIINAMKLPRDSADDRLIVSMNAYYPADFSWAVEADDTSATDAQTDTAATEWGGAEDEADLDSFFGTLDARFVSRGTPVMIGEFGTADKGNDAARERHAAYFVTTAKKYDIPCFWWDAGDLLLRRSLTWSFPDIVNAMVDSTSRHLRHANITVGPAYYTGEPVEPDVTITWSGTVVSDGDVVSATDLKLTRGVDYELSFADNIERVDADLVITGMGKYSGIIEMKYKITDAPGEAGVLGRLAKDDPDLPLVVMLSIPILVTLAVIAVYQYMQRRERHRVNAVISAAMAEEYDRKYGIVHTPASEPEHFAESPDDFDDQNGFDLSDDFDDDFSLPPELPGFADFADNEFDDDL